MIQLETAKSLFHSLKLKLINQRISFIWKCDHEWRFALEDFYTFFKPLTNTICPDSMVSGVKKLLFCCMSSWFKFGSFWFTERLLCKPAVIQQNVSKHSSAQPAPV